MRETDTHRDRETLGETQRQRRGLRGSEVVRETDTERQRDTRRDTKGDREGDSKGGVG